MPVSSIFRLGLPRGTSELFTSSTMLYLSQNATTSVLVMKGCRSICGNGMSALAVSVKPLDHVGDSTSLIDDW